MKRIILILYFLPLWLPGHAWAGQPVKTETIAYKLAYIHTKAMDPEEAFVQGSVKPKESVVKEFQWILDSMKYRCKNPQTAIAETIVHVWYALKKNGKDLPLLETAHQLSRIAQNTALFENEKVNFIITSKYWLYHKIHNKPMKQVVPIPKSLQ